MVRGRADGREGEMVGGIRRRDRGRDGGGGDRDV